MNDVEILKKAPLLQGLSEEQLAAMLAINPIMTYRRGDVVFEEDSSGREIFIVLAGEVAAEVDPAREGAIEKGSTELRVIRTFRPGESFGEVAVVDSQPRTATIVATQDDTRLLMLPSQIFDNVLQAQMILNNIARDLSEKVRGSNRQIIENMLAGYFLTVLVENLSNDAHRCDPIIPLQQAVVIRNQDSFILSGESRLVSDIPEKEAIEILCFSEAPVLQDFLAPGEPSGAVIFNGLFSLIRSGQLSQRIANSANRYQVECSPDRRRGTLTVQKTLDGSTRTFTLVWQIKGARYRPDSRTTTACMALYLSTDAASATETHAKQMIANIAMPVQKYIYNSFPQKDVGSKTRIIIIHHRSHETARTLQTVRELGYQIDSFIGIPYGDVNWDYITMLDQASDHNYMSLQLVTHPTRPTQYQFDFRQSSFVDRETEQAIFALYEDPAINSNYLTAMQALAEYRLGQALRRCRDNGERLIIYEDGGYIVARVYDIYKNPQHPLHPLIKSAVDDNLIIGVVEVTVAGERKNQQVIEENNGKALLPVLSNARSDIKAVFEAMGVAEAVIHASATALGRLGLPTFQARRVAIIGANGAIGTRLIEQFAALHNSTANIFAIARSEKPFSLTIDSQRLPYAATRLKYRQIGRHLVRDTCLPVILDVPYTGRTFQPETAAVSQAVEAFLQDGHSYDEAAITAAHPLPETEIQALWQQITQQTGYEPIETTPLENNNGVRCLLRNGSQQKTVALLNESVVITFENVSRAILNGVDTIIGSTGLPVFSAKNLDDFFVRQNTSGQTDTLVLISASSKDYEFKQAIDFLNRLLQLQSGAHIPAETQLKWYAEFYKDGLSFLQDEDFAPLQSLLAGPLSAGSLQTFIQAAPAAAKAMSLHANQVEQAGAQLADYIAAKIRQRISLRKEIRPDIGSIYHVTVNGETKRVVLLADGLVINFFARHEKGVKTEYIDPIVTMQVLSLVKLCSTPIEPALYKMDVHLRPEDLNIFWAAINDYCRPLSLTAR